MKYKLSLKHIYPPALQENAIKYPADKCKGSAEKYTVYQDAGMMPQDSQAAQAPAQQAQVYHVPYDLFSDVFSHVFACLV
jgi:hypothetical protein